MVAFRTFQHSSGLVQHLAVADLLRDAGEAIVAQATVPVSIVYSDPPWNPKIEKWWRRYAGADPQTQYDDLLDAWCRCVAALKPEHVFCEQSINPRHRQMFLDAVVRASWTIPLREEWTVYYGGSRSEIRPSMLLHFGMQPLSVNPTGLCGEPVTRKVFDGIELLSIRHERSRWLVDPCMGKGMTSRMAAEYGWSCIGTELSAYRLGYTIRWLLQHGYVEAMP